MLIFCVLLILSIIFIATSYSTNSNVKRSYIIKRSELYDSKTFDSKIQLNLANLFTISKFLDEFATTNIQGVYTVINNKEEVQYVGNSLDVVNHIKKHYETHGSNVVHSIRVQSFAQPTNDALMAYKNELIRQTNPWGNAIGTIGWNIDNDSFDSQSKPNTNVFSNANIDKLSSLKQSIAEAAAEDAVRNPVSPFDEEIVSNSNMAMKIASSDGILEFTKENVDTVLNEIRPYLIADGGNVAVAEIDIDKRTVSLILEGACGSCPSSTTTMKMGIERVLRENFPNLTEVINLAQSLEPVKPTELTIEAVNEALQKILSAISGMGGKVLVESVDPSIGLVVLKYLGPQRLKQGIELVVKDVKFVKAVEIKPYDT
jgi:Fe-S cluster biogenesis protein NfuA